MKLKKLPFAFTWLFLLTTLIFSPEYSLSFPLSEKAAFSWIAIIFFSFLVVKNLLQASREEYAEVALYFKSKVPFFKKDLIESKMVLRLVYSGLLSWILMIIFKNTFLSLPLFILGLILMAWGLSTFMEDNGLYHLSRSSLSNKWFLGGAFSSILYWAGFKSAEQINSVFSIDPSFFPFTLSAMILVNVFVLFCLFMVPVFFICCALLFFNIVKLIIRKKDYTQSRIFMAVLVFSAYAAIIGLKMQSPKLQNHFVNLIALKTDFNSKHLCANDRLKGIPVIFLGPNSRRVLAISRDSHNEYQVYQCITP